MTKELTTTEDRTLADMAKVNDLADRIAEFLPQSRQLPKDTRLTIAQIALAHRLDPFLGDIWAIPERQKVGGEWQTTGYRIMIGITAWRRAAQDSGEYWGRHFEKATDEERKWLGVGPNDLAMRCVIYRRKTGQQPAEYDGFGVFRQGEPSKMNPLQCVRLRAERDALKGAFPIGFGGGSVKIGVADDTGEEINGEVPHGPKWDIITTGKPPIEQLQKIDEVKAMNIGQPVDTAMRDPEEDEIFGSPATQEAPASASQTVERKAFRIASVKFNGMTADQWHALADKFAADNPNWQKNGKPDMQHILVSAGKAGYADITSENIDEVFAAIVAAHEGKAQA